MEGERLTDSSEPSESLGPRVERLERELGSGFGRARTWVPPAPGRWHAPEKDEREARRRLARSLYAEALIPTGVSLLGLTVSAGLSFLFEGALDWLVAIWSVLVVAFAVTAWIQLRRRVPALPEELAMIEDPYREDVCLTRVTIWDGPRCVGTDHGVVWFEGGAMFFSGRRTSFVVAGTDVSDDRFAPRGTRGAFRLPIFRPEGTAWLAFQPLDYRSATRVATELSFRENLRRFAAERPKAAVARQYPPFDAQGEEA